MGQYRDGTSEARGWYGGDPSHHDVTPTTAGDVLTDVEITIPEEAETSLGNQQSFANALPDAVIGRPVDEFNVAPFAGSSRCSEGLVSALAQIKTDIQT